MLQPVQSTHAVRGFCALCTAHCATIATVTDGIALGVVCCQHGWWQECKELELPAYDAYNEQSANPSLLIGSDLADPISGSLPHRSFLCRVRPAE
jgi:hypothetical protein